MQTLPVTATASLIQDPEVRGLLAQSQPGSITFYPLDSMIYAQGDNAGPLYLVEFGTVRICRLTADGRRQITGFCYAGDIFGLEEGDEHQSQDQPERVRDPFRALNPALTAGSPDAGRIHVRPFRPRGAVSCRDRSPRGRRVAGLWTNIAERERPILLPSRSARGAQAV